MDVGASGTRSMAWSYHHQSGNRSEVVSEKTFSRSWYCSSTSLSQLFFFFLVAASASCCTTVVFSRRVFDPEAIFSHPFQFYHSLHHPIGPVDVRVGSFEEGVS